MTFTSSNYLSFLPATYLVYYFAADRWRWLVLLLASYAFYCTFKAPQLVIALVLVTLVSYSCALRLARVTDDRQKKTTFLTGVAACVFLLVGIKLAPLLTAWFGIGQTPASGNLLLSIGISYFSFQAISYLADVYLEIEEPEPHLGYHALALALFPKLLQGPIERAGDLLPQLKQRYVFDYDAMRSGLLLFAWGLFKKTVVADRLALYVDPVYNNLHDYTGLPLLIATYAYALQIFFDFSGYTDMARGTARLFGINLTENFNSPYRATTIADFWRRWHISFSRWILDYIFKPLQMSWRAWGQNGTALALLVTFLVSGLWHGLSIGFLIWGLLHGVYLAASTYYRPYQKKLYKALNITKSRWLPWWQTVVTFHLVCLAWVFFRAATVGDALYLLQHLGAGVTAQLARLPESDFVKAQILIGNEGVNTVILLLFTAVALAVNALRNRYTLQTQPVWRRWPLYVLLSLVIMIFDAKSKAFVYFQF